MAGIAYVLYTSTLGGLGGFPCMCMMKGVGGSLDSNVVVRISKLSYAKE